MEDYLIFIKTLVISLVSVILVSVLRVVHVYWFRPKSLEKQLRKQGIRGKTYRLFQDDMKEISMSSKEACAKPMSLNHQIAPRIFPFFHQMVQNYGKVSLGWIETRPRLIIADPELIKLILAEKNGQITKPPLNPLVNLLQMGISTLEGEQWAKRRRLIKPAFHLEKLKGMVPAFVTCCFGLINRWESLVGHEGRCELDVAPEFQNLAGDVIARTAFGSNYEEGKKIFELQKKQAVLVLEAYYDFYFPGKRFIPTKKNRMRYNLDNEIKAILRGMISKKEQAAMENGEEGANDLLGLLLQCKEQEQTSMTIEDVIEECKLFYFAGQETTANWLTWAMIVLSMHPDWQEKAREEVLRVCGKNTPDLDALNHLKIVSMILKEVLRLYSPVSALYRHTQIKTNVGGISIPAGVEFVLLTMFLHHDKKCWGEDVEEFNPERFAEGVVKEPKDQVVFYPFGWGPRICIGQTFAVIEAKMALAMILQHFSFELSPSYTHAPVMGITLQPQHGATVTLHRI
ncbi:cytochrome P450 72A397 [Pyrus x bretschneideri]|uniref:cytochrome P450 72A397 n=1 Tax=Pyrus x bretschneideri TaxID=225117 RepID=UPI00202F9414|nr:cytochrome P450 72A397 [Pyrus x bretschneideri]